MPDMPRYSVSVRYEQEKRVRVWAKDEAEAERKAQEMVAGWDGVLSAESDSGSAEETEV